MTIAFSHWQENCLLPSFLKTSYKADGMNAAILRLYFREINHFSQIKTKFFGDRFIASNSTYFGSIWHILPDQQYPFRPAGVSQTLVAD